MRAARPRSFQYSIRDAGSRRGRRGGYEHGPFNTLLEMPEGSPWRACYMSSGSFNTLLEMRRSPARAYTPCPSAFQYSIRDAPHSHVDRPLAEERDFQYSIRDAGANAPLF